MEVARLEVPHATMFYDLITECLLKRKQSIAEKKESIGIKVHIEINIAGGKESSGFVHFSVLMLAISNVPVIDFIVALHQQNVGCDLICVSPFRLSTLSGLLAEKTLKKKKRC